MTPELTGAEQSFVNLVKAQANENIAENKLIFWIGASSDQMTAPVMVELEAVYGEWFVTKHEDGIEFRKRIKGE